MPMQQLQCRPPGRVKNNSEVRRCGILLQVALFLLNGILWALALYCIGFAIVIGISSGMISTWESNRFAWFISTPASIFLFYGLPMFSVATFGCFSSVSANPILLIIYVCLIILLPILDLVFGLGIILTGSYARFIDSLLQSMDNYIVDDSTGVGIFPIHSRIFWDHIQLRTQCCGLYSYWDWRNTSLGRQDLDIPESCCNELYDYVGCGHLLWKHPDTEFHTLEDIVFRKGCMYIYPTFLQDKNTESITIAWRFLIAVLFFIIILAIALMFLVLSRGFRTSVGLNNPGFIDAPADPQVRSNRVHPWDRNAMGDCRIRRISFDDRGPTYIPERRREGECDARRQRQYPPRGVCND